MYTQIKMTELIINNQLRKFMKPKLIEAYNHGLNNLSQTEFKEWVKEMLK